jgi:asparagine N-glycosylation enzyme membrane subunit Stt3
VSYYRISALAFGLARMWRGWVVIVPVVVLNAVFQALLILPDPTPGLNASAILIGLLSA